MLIYRPKNIDFFTWISERFVVRFDILSVYIAKSRVVVDNLKHIMVELGGNLAFPVIVAGDIF